MYVEIPGLPLAMLNPNRIGHYMVKHNAKQQAKNDIMAAVLQQGRLPEPMTDVIIKVDWFATDRRRRDIDNLIASMKPYIDGLVLAGVLVDDSATHVRYAEFDYWAKCDTAKTVLHITPRGECDHGFGSHGYLTDVYPDDRGMMGGVCRLCDDVVQQNAKGEWEVNT